MKQPIVKKNLITATVIILILFSFVAICGTAFFSAPTDKAFAVGEAGNLNRGWIYGDSAGTLPQIELPYQVERSGHKQLVISNLLPAQGMPDWTLAIRTSYQSLEVYVDDRLIHQYKQEDSPYFSAPPNSWQLIPLSPDMAGKKISIKYEIPYTLWTTVIAGNYIGHRETCLATIWGRGLSALLVNLWILCTAVLVLVFAFIFAKGSKQRGSMVHLGIFSGCCGMWLLCSNGILQFFTGNLYIASAGAVCFRILTALALIALIMGQVRTDANSRRFQRIFIVFVALLVASAIVPLVTPMDLNRMDSVNQVAVILLSFDILRTSARMRKHRISDTFMGRAAAISALFIIDGGRRLYPLYAEHATALISIGFFLILTAWWIAALRSIYIDIQENNQMREQIIEGRVQLMLSQIKPHFIYNALNSIHILIKKNPDIACNMVTNFSAYLRSNMNAMGTKRLEPFSEELAHIKAYVEIEKVRFPNIDVVFEIDERNFNIPVLTVEPLVENAIKHGVAKSRSGGVVIIRSYQSGRDICIEVKDNGVGFDVKALDDLDGKRSIGLKNVKYRIDSMMGGRLTIESQPGKGTVAKIVISAEKARGEPRDENNIG